MSKLPTLIIFTLATPFIFCIAITTLLWYSHKKDGPSFFTSSQRNFFTALPVISDITGMEVKANDARIEMVRQFFSKYNSPLEPYAKDVIEAADKYGLDFRLIPAIAMQESTLCKKVPKDSNNCWGYGIYGKKTTSFPNYKEAIYTVTKTLAVNYKKDGLHSAEEIMTRYTPSSNGSWAKGVTTVMNALQ